jgi:hypothetical protein
VVLVPTACAQAGATPPPRKVLPPLAGVYHAAYPNWCGSEDCVSAQKIRSFEALVGKRIVWAYFSDNWFHGIVFPATKVRTIWSVHHTIPFIRLMPRAGWVRGCVDKTYSLDKIVAGRFDAALRRYARAAAATRIPLMMEFGTEANGDWFPWSGVCNGGPGVFRDAFRHVVDVFRRASAANVTWVLHLDATGGSFAAYYPGPKYVDWVGLSAYGSQQEGDPRPSFNDVFEPAYRALAAAAPGKPLALLEFGTIEDGVHDKAAWIAAALHNVAVGRYPRLKAVAYWDANWSDDGRGPSIMGVDSSPAALAAYRSAVATSAFVSVPRLAAAAASTR